MEGNNDTLLSNSYQEIPEETHNIHEESQNEYTDSDSIPPLVTDSESENDSLLSQEDQPVFITETVAVVESAEENEDSAGSEDSSSEESESSEYESENESEEEFEADERSVHSLAKFCIRRIGDRAKNHKFVVMKDQKPVFVSDCIYSAFNTYEQLFLKVVLDEMSNNRIVLDHSIDTMECIFRTDISVENRFYIISYIKPHSTFELHMI